MQLAELVEATARALGAQPADVRSTHVSTVLIAGEFVYKFKKPVDYGFIDYSTLEKRKHFCELEVRLNSDLAPDVYLGVVPVGLVDGRAVLGDEARIPVEHAVRMRRLPDDAHLRARLDRGEEVRPILERLVRRLVHVYDQPERRWDGVGDPAGTLIRRAAENFEESAAFVGRTVSRSVFDRLVDLNRRRSTELAPLLNRRSNAFARRTHGDLRLDHVYQLREDADPVVIDCVEFDESLSLADVAADLAFLAMDLAADGRRDLAAFLQDSYVNTSGDFTSARLFPFLIAYRSAVRAKVRGLAADGPDVPDDVREASSDRAKEHWLLALDQLEEPGRRPGLILIGGLPGSGKSTLARKLASECDFMTIRSDVVRKELAGAGDVASPFGEGIYSEDWTERTYAECLRRAEEALFEGRRVIVDASFGKRARRSAFRTAADRLGVRSTFVLCQVERAIALERIRNRRDDASDADVSIHEEAAKRWEPVDPAAPRFDGSQAADRTLLEHLESIGLI